MTRRLRRAGGFAAASALATVALLGLAAPAHAAGTVTVDPAPGVDGPTTVTLTGTGFQYVPNAPGGLYVMFGVVSDPASWAPSQGGQSGVTYSYAGDDGAISMIGFAGGSTDAGDGTAIQPDGSWTTQITIPGPEIVLGSGRPGAESTGGEAVDCREVTCGVITIGAMGNVNANNESFTPVVFAEPEPEPTEEPTPEPTAEPAEEATADADTDTDAEAAPAETEGEASATGWIVGGIAAGVAVLAAVIAFAVRNRAKKSDAASATTID